MEPKRAPRLLGPESVKIGLAVFIALSVVAVMLWASNETVFFHWADSRGFLRFARDPIPGPRARFSGTHGDSTYHFARVLLPGLAWALALGRSQLVGWTLVIVNNASMGLLFAVGAEFLARSGRRESNVFWLAVFPGLWMFFALIYSELLATALLFLVYLLWLDVRPRGTRVVAALLPLARETALLGILPLVWRDYRREGLRGAASWLPCLVPTAVWWGLVWGRMGAIPPLAHSAHSRGVLGLPFSGLVSNFQRNGLGWVFVTIVGISVFAIAFAAFVALRRRCLPFSAAASLFALVVACLGWRGAWYVGETLRHATVVYLLAAMCVLLGARRRDVSDSPEQPMVQPDRALSRSGVSP